MNWHLLPNAPLAGNNPGVITQAFLIENASLQDFHQACEYVWSLPYGRTQQVEVLSVLEEGKGTCSSKHLLLKQLADELGLKVDLILGIYPMSEANTPGVGPVLDQFGLTSVPEAHCYLSANQTRFDFTRNDVTPKSPIDRFYTEESLSPKQLLAEKKSRHQQFIADYCQQAFNKSLTAGELWQVREECIQALSVEVV